MADRYSFGRRVGQAVKGRFFGQGRKDDVLEFIIGGPVAKGVDDVFFIVVQKAGP